MVKPTELEIIWQDFVGKALVLVNPTELKIVYQDFVGKILEPVCCKKQQKKVPDQLLVCGIGHLWRTWMIRNKFEISWKSLKVKYRSGEISIDHYMNLDLGYQYWTDLAMWPLRKFDLKTWIMTTKKLKEVPTKIK